MNLRRLSLLFAAGPAAAFLLSFAPAQAADPSPAAATVRRGPALLIAGQSREEFRDYLNHVIEKGSAAPRPGGAAFYTSLDSNGISSPHANAPGDNHQDLDYLKLVQEPLVIQVGLWLSRDQLRPVAAGDYDARIQRLRQALADLKRPVFLRIGYEFDGPHNRYPPEAFIEAYRAIARAMRAHRDILLVWHSYAMLPTYQESAVADWYPGDDYVDWIGISVFQIGDEGYHRAPNRDRVLEFARAKAKPVLVAEASAIRYTRRQKTLTGQAYWDYWYKPFFDLIESHPEIKAVSIINVDWDSQNQHRELEWGDCRLNSDPVVLRHWRAKAAEPYWLKPDAALYDSVRSFSGPDTQPKPSAQRQN